LKKITNPTLYISNCSEEPFEHELAKLFLKAYFI
jgi:hypothetical protein